MIYLKLFINFLIIGTLSFGGGYGMISLMREIVLSNHWLSEDMFMSFVAVAESTPGPLAVNLATFVGSSGRFSWCFFCNSWCSSACFYYSSFNCGSSKKSNEIFRYKSFSVRRTTLCCCNDSCNCCNNGTFNFV